LDDDHDSGLDVGLSGGPDSSGSADSSLDEDDDHTEALALGIYELGRGNRGRTEAMIRNGGLSAENLARFSNSAGPSRSYNLDQQISLISEGRPVQEREQMTIRLRGHRSLSSVVSETAVDQERELKNVRLRRHRRQSI
jgi:hypothetical protein